MHGAGRQTLTWKVQRGSWSIVLMNADGSPAVDARVSAGASIPLLTELGWGSLGAGLLLLAAAAGLLLVGIRTPLTRHTSPTPTAAEPAAA